ncbi:MAG: hypothetical protein NVS2B14_11960 [Chamaesiphon sp.]
MQYFAFVNNPGGGTNTDLQVFSTALSPSGDFSASLNWGIQVGMGALGLFMFASLVSLAIRGR